MSHWQDISTAPKSAPNSIIWLANDQFKCVGYWALGAWRNWYAGPDYRLVVETKGRVSTSESVPLIWFEPTHWQPLPDLPGDTQ